MIQAGVPVMGHLGLTPQSVNQFGGYGLRAKEEAEAEKLLHDAKRLDEAGCFSIVLEKIPAALAKRVTEAVSCPVIGIGAGNGCDGQVLVLHDMLGLNQGFKPKFLRHFASLGAQVKEAVENYVEAVKDSSFPSAEESY
jgi:3-methyl-2-oxobutanoate hydroxymethyltransferase